MKDHSDLYEKLNALKEKLIVRARRLQALESGYEDYLMMESEVSCLDGYEGELLQERKRLDQISAEFNCFLFDVIKQVSEEKIKQEIK